MSAGDRILDGDSVNRGQEATGQSCYKCRTLTDEVFKRWSELENEALENGCEDLAWVFRQNYEQGYQHLRNCNAKLILRRRVHAGHELGAREFTLTYSKRWYDDETARTLMVQAVRRLVKYYMTQIVEFVAVGETGKNGASHIHGYYLLQRGKKITDKNFQRAYAKWNPKKKLGSGHEGGHHAIVQNESDFLGYIDKEENPWFKYNFKDVQDPDQEQGEEAGSTSDGSVSSLEDEC